MRIGFIGLGNMGGPMALNLMKAGHALVVHDVRPDAAKPHLDGGAKWADSPKALARASELILTSLPGPKEVEAVALGPDGIIHGEVRPVLQAVGDKVGYMGPIGAGTIAKLVHNMIGIATRAVFAEGFTLGVKAGVKPEALLEAIRGAAFGQGLMLSQMLPNVIFRGDFDTVRFALKLARKDIGLATELAREYDVPMPLAAVAEQIMVEAMARGWGDKDSTAPWMLQEEAAGVQVRERK